MGNINGERESTLKTEGFNATKCIAKEVQEYEPTLYPIIFRGIVNENAFLIPTDTVEVKAVLLENTLNSIQQGLDSWQTRKDLSQSFIDEQRQQAERTIADIGTNLVELASSHKLTFNTSVKALGKLLKVSVSDQLPHPYSMSVNSGWAVYETKSEGENDQQTPKIMLAMLNTLSHNPTERVTLVDINRLLEQNLIKLGNNSDCFNMP